MGTKRFKVEDISELVIMGDMDGFKVIKDEIYDTTRWSIQHEMVFKAPDGKFYRTIYETGATEYQDYNYWDDWEPECQEVEPVEVTVIEYKAV